MTIQAQKLELVKLILDIEDKSVLKNIKQLVTASKKDWWDEISEAERKAIKEGIAQADRGEVVPHKEVMKKIRAKYKL